MTLLKRQNSDRIYTILHSNKSVSKLKFGKSIENENMSSIVCLSLNYKKALKKYPLARLGIPCKHWPIKSLSKGYLIYFSLHPLHTVQNFLF